MVEVPFEEHTLEELRGNLNSFERKNAPGRVFTAGDVALLSYPSVSVVGSRDASENALKRTRKLVTALVQNNVVIVSGLAKGVDTAALKAAIDAGGKTIGVIGNGLDVFYPKENQRLQQTMMREHLVLSQFPLGSSAKRTNFPQRNRTMAIISSATVIVEAGETSGTLSQGWEALRLNRSLFIMKAVVESGLNWPKEMLHYGAIVLEDTQQIMDILPSLSIAKRHRNIDDVALAI